MRTIILEARRMQEPEEAHRYLKEKLMLREYYGGNLDALFDCLTELDKTEIQIRDARIGEGYLNRIIEVMMDAAEENKDLTVVVL